MYPDNLRYTKDHEWVDAKGGQGTIGVTFFAQKELGDVVFVELPEVGRQIKQGEIFGTIESVKAVSELFSPIAGEVTEINRTLADRPESVNTDPHNAWMIAIKPSGAADQADLLDAGQYTQLTQ